MKAVTFWIGVIAFSAVCNGVAAPTQNEDGGADTYSEKARAEKPPRIEVVDGKNYYYWPELGQWPNNKLQLRGDRTAHPDAQWFPDAGLGLFMHWGIVSEFEPSGEAWSGRWTAKREEQGIFYPQTEIWAAAETFNPESYNPGKWMAAAKAAGFNYAVLTTKHHDGYALWDSDVAKIGVRQYLDGRDLVKPYVEACRKNGVKVGFYYSGMDWYYDRESMNFSVQPGVKINYKGEKVDSLPARPADYLENFAAFNEEQVRELLKFTPDLWWGDGGAGMEIAEIRKLQPGILCNNRNQGRNGDYVTPEGNHMAVPRYIKPVVENGWWWESCEIVNGGSWHYSQKAEKINQTDKFLYRLAEIRSMGGNMLANIAPRPDGEMPEQAYRLFSGMANWMKSCRESIYQINGGCGLDPDKANAPVTIRDQIWYVHVRSDMATPQKPVVLKDMVRPASVSLLRTGDDLAYEFSDGVLKLTVPGDCKYGKGTDVIKLVFDDVAVSEPFFFKNRQGGREDVRHVGSPVIPF